MIQLRLNLKAKRIPIPITTTIYFRQFIMKTSKGLIATALLTSIIATGCASTASTNNAYEATANNVTNSALSSAINSAIQTGATSADIRQAAISGAVNGLLNSAATPQKTDTTNGSNTTTTAGQ